MKVRTWLVIALVVLCSLAAGGCQRFNAERQVFGKYYVTTLKLTTPADFMSIVRDEGELLSRTESVAALWGQKKEMAILWFNAVAFDDQQATAARKYCLAVNEKAKGRYITPFEKLRFDAQLVLPNEILRRPYADRNQMRIAIIKHIKTKFSQDMEQLREDSTVLQSGSMMVSQILSTMLQKLDTSPALAATLSDYAGMDFDHVPLGPAKVRMLIEDDIVKIKVKVGKDWFNRQRFEHHPDVVNM